MMFLQPRDTTSWESDLHVNSFLHVRSFQVDPNGITPITAGSTNNVRTLHDLLVCPSKSTRVIPWPIPSHLFSGTPVMATSVKHIKTLLIWLWSKIGILQIPIDPQSRSNGSFWVWNHPILEPLSLTHPKHGRAVPLHTKLPLTDWLEPPRNEIPMFDASIPLNPD